ISRYPITNAQYRPFVEGSGYDEARHWTPEGWAWRTGHREPDLSPLEDVQDEQLKQSYARWLAQREVDRRGQPFWWDDPHWGSPNRPVVGLCWYEALAYCSWLTERMKETGGRGRVWHNGHISDSQYPISQVRLPTEAEWEKSARGSRGFCWPWGNEWHTGRANTDEAGIRETSAVGAFPAGASPWGVLDLAGNVWEWTASRWGRTTVSRPDYGYPYDPGDGREELDGPDFRVVRGGSWRDLQRFARCAYRDRLDPDFYDFSVGFRVVVSLASSDC
ncbi:MAG: formylglycine-generating enzyme family protein, partial [Anaerolineaceae bacterium]|nr:formylglycine-generating enzyme family protein [Anaerolineaceae bacterium]